MPTTQQRTLSNYTSHTYPNLPSAGDIFTKDVEDGIICCAFQNIHGATVQSGLQITPEIDTMSDWNISIMGMSETNRP